MDRQPLNRRQLKADLRVAEGIRNVVYDDQTGHPIGPGSHVMGHPSIGVGRRCDLPFSVPVIELLLEESIDQAIAALDRELPWWTDCTESQQRALVELVFNLGMQGLLGFPHFLLRLRTGQLHAAACELATAKWATDVGPTRAHRIIDQIQQEA
jgi:lysozyme